jgi:hypothetical protein
MPLKPGFIPANPTLTMLDGLYPLVSAIIGEFAWYLSLAFLGWNFDLPVCLLPFILSLDPLFYNDAYFSTLDPFPFFFLYNIIKF